MNKQLAAAQGKSAQARQMPSHVLGATLAAVLLGLSTPSHAEVSLSGTTGSVYTLGGLLGVHTRKLTMRVGSYYFGSNDNIANVSLVTFDVSGANVSPSPGSVAGIPSGHLPVSGSTPNGVRIQVSSVWTDFSQNQVIVRADSQAGLICTTAATCGNTVIPFNKISWVSSKAETGTYAGKDFASGAFTGSGNQVVLDLFTAPNQKSPTIYNDWNFSYSNDTLYPAGVYQGRVTFTAFMP